MANGDKAKLSLELPVFVSALVMAFFLCLYCPDTARAAFGDCPAGYRFDRMSGVGCVQADCGSIPSAHYSYEGYCICGSAGSIAENPADPNKRCTLPGDNSACPNCVYACVHNGENCPDAPGATAVAAPTPAAGEPAGQDAPAPDDEPASGVTDTGAETETSGEPSADNAGNGTGSVNAETNEAGVSLPQGLTEEQLSALLNNDIEGGPVIVRAGIGDGLSNAVKRGFSVMMEMLGWGTEKVLDVKIIENKDDENAGWSGLVVTPSGDWVDVKIFEGRLALSWDDGIGAEFNLISIKGRPGSNSFIDGFSIGIGPGSASGEEASPSVPGTPVSPNINVRNIRNWFDETWNDTRSWWQENVPWPLGSADAPAIGGGGQ